MGWWSRCGLELAALTLATQNARETWGVCCAPPTRRTGAMGISHKGAGKRQVAAATRSCVAINPDCRSIAKFLASRAQATPSGSIRMRETCNVGGSPSRRRLIKAALAGLAAPAVLRMGTALAAYPDRPVRIVVANTPGGPSDIIARFMAAAMQEAMSASVVVENKGGGGGNIGMGYVARADADGYTILLSTSAYAVNPGLYNTPPYDPFKDFVAVCELAVSPHVFAVMPDLRANTMKEFVALAKADPDKFNVSTPPIGTTPQLQAEVLKLREG